MKNEQTDTACEKVSTAIPLNDFRLLVTFRNMELRIFDCSEMFRDDTVDRTIFDAVHADADGVSWKNGLCVSSDKLYEDSVDLVDFLNEAISGAVKPDARHDPFFVHDDETPDDFFHGPVWMIGKTHYNYGRKDEEAAVAERFVKIMQHGGIVNGADIIIQLRVFLGLDMEDALDYYLQFM